MNMSVGVFIVTHCQGEVGPGVAFTVNPSLTGDAIVGETLTVSLGTATGADSLAGSLRHVSDDTEVDTFAADGTYVIQDTDFGEQLYLHVTAEPGGVEATSAATGAVGLPTSNLLAWWYGGGGASMPAEIDASGDGGAVTTWATKSTPTISPTQGTEANRPVYRQSVTDMNNRGAVEFDGTDDYLVATLAAALSANQTAYCKFVVFRTTTAFSNDYVYGEGWTGGTVPLSAVAVNRSISGDVGALVRGDGGNTANLIVGDLDSNDGAAHLLVIRRVDATRFEAWLDNVLVVSVTASDAIGTTTINRLAIGALVRSSVGSYFGGQVACIADYGSIDLTPVTSALMQHYGVADRALRGVWTWYNDPRAVASGDTLWIGMIDKHGNINVATYDTAAEEITYSTFLGSLPGDDHNNPSFLIRNDGKLMVFYVGHNTSVNYYVRISTNANDATAFATAVDFGSSLGVDNSAYGNPVQLTGEANDPIYLFFRGLIGTDFAQYYTVSTDGGATWSAGVNWLENSGQRPYLKVAQNGDSRIDLAFTDAHGGVDNNNIYHAYLEGGSLYKTDGTLVGAIGAGPYAPSDFTKVYDGATDQAWIHQIIIDDSGHPVLVYAAFPSTTDHRYRYARWNGSAWTEAQICTAGTYLYAAEPRYSGGIVIDPDNVDVVYASRETGSGVHQVWKFTTADGGATWDAGVQMTSSADKAFRPYVVGGKLLYVTGTYTSYTNYDTRIVVTDL